MLNNETSIPHMSAAEFIKRHKKEHKFFFYLEEDEWREALKYLKQDRLAFLMMWYYQNDIYILFLEKGFRPLGVRISTSVDRYLAISSVCPAAIIYERTIWDLWGKEAMNGVDSRPWLDRGLWTHTWPLSDQPGPVMWPPESYEYHSPADLLQKGGDIAVIDPSSCKGFSPSLWYYSMMGENVIHAESLYGYTHRGILSGLQDCNILEVLPKISRINAVDSVAHQIAFSHAMEDIAQFIPDSKILRKRAVLSEISRISANLLYLSHMFRALNIDMIAARCELARELLMRWNAHNYGHRWLMDCVFPGTVRDVEQEKFSTLPIKIKYLFSEARKLSEGFAGLLEAVQDVGVLQPEKAIQFGIGGIIGRASGRDIDIRRYMPEYRLEWLSPRTYTNGDVYSRMQLRFQETENALDIVEMLLQHVDDEVIESQPDIVIETLYGEGIGVCEGVQGDLWYYLKIEGGKIKNIAIRDPAANQAYVLQEVLQNSEWDKQVVIKASFGILSTGVDF